MIYRDEASNTIVCSSRWYKLRNQIAGAIEYLTKSTKIPCLEEILLSLKEVEQCSEKRIVLLESLRRDKEYRSMIGLHETFDDIQEDHVENIPQEYHLLAVKVSIKKMFS